MRKPQLKWVCMMMLIPLIKVSGQVTAVGARSVSLSGIMAGLEDPWAVGNNPAGLANYDHFSIATSLEQQYLMGELGNYSLAAALPVNRGCLGTSILFSGYNGFIDQKLNLAYAMPAGESISAGVSLVYSYQKAGNENTPTHQLSYQFGAIVRLTGKASLAFTTFNPFQVYLKSTDYASLPSIFRLGFAYEYTTSFLILAETEKDLYYPPVFKIGSEYNIRERFLIRGGIRMFPFSWSFGAAFREKKVLFEFASSYHQYLGFSPVVSLQYDLR
jgi:hypothetical protein